MAMLHGAPRDERPLKLRAMEAPSPRVFIGPSGGLKPLTRLDAQSIVLGAGMALGIVGHSNARGFYEIEKGE